MAGLAGSRGGTEVLLDRSSGDGPLIGPLAAAISATGTEDYVGRLIDLVGEIVPHDVITVTRYAVGERPAFVSHRHYDDAMVRRYLEVYYAYDPFHAYWQRERRPGVVPLRGLADEEVKRGRYIAEFLRQSVICDEVGVLLDDGEGCCLGIFLDRASRVFATAETAALETRFPVLAALHGVHLRARRGGTRRGVAPGGNGSVGGARPLPTGGVPAMPPDLWPALSARERDVVALILAGHPSATLARRLGITVGTVKNHRRRIYAKLDITTERELFLGYFDFMSGGKDT